MSDSEENPGGAPADGLPDERPQRRREYSGAASTLGLAAAIIGVVALALWFFEFRSSDPAESPTGGIVELPAAQNPTGEAPAAREGRAAPNFRLQTVDGTSLALTDLRGKAVILNFWASWCPPCRGETPDLQRLAEATGAAGRLAVVGVNQQESLSTAKSFLTEYSVTYPVVLDADGGVSAGYRISRGLPITLLIDAQGVIQRIYLGRLTSDDITKLIADYGV